MLSEMKRTLLIKKILFGMPELLSERYGYSEFYSLGQIEKTMEFMDLGESFKGYAVAVFANPKVAVSELRSLELYNTLRDEMTSEFLNGETDFRKLFDTFDKSENFANDSIGVITD